MWSHSRLSISRRRVPGPRAASASAAVSTHSRGRPWPRAARTRSLTHLLACHVSDRAPFSLQTPVERSERLAGCWAVRARAHPLSLAVWHFTLRFVLPGSWVGHPSPQRPKGKAVACSHHLDPKSTQRGSAHSTLFQASAFAPRSFSIFILAFSAFAPSGNKPPRVINLNPGS